MLSTPPSIDIQINDLKEVDITPVLKAEWLQADWRVSDKRLAMKCDLKKDVYKIGLSKMCLNGLFFVGTVLWW